MKKDILIVGTQFEEIEISQATITGVFRDNDRDTQGILPFYNAPVFYLVELSFDGGERQGLWMGQCPTKAQEQAKAWSDILQAPVKDRTMGVCH